MTIQIKSFAKLTTAELYNMLKIRTEVFVVEQSCPYLEVDGKDIDSYHLIKELDGEIVAYLRILPPGVSYKELSIGRVLVHPNYRGKQYGREIMEEALRFIREELNEQTIKIQAQEYLQRFYESFGFKGVSDVYLDDNIPHIDMILEKLNEQ